MNKKSTPSKNFNYAKNINREFIRESLKMFMYIALLGFYPRKRVVAAALLK